MAWDDIPEWALDTARQLLAEVKAQDEFTYDHCLRVGRGSRQLAKALGLNEYEQAIVEYSGLFHDIGKARIPVEVLTKPGRLDSREIEIMKEHPTFSAEMIQHLEHVPFFRFLLPGIKYHHERMDGGGYPADLRGEAIPLFARIICVVDSHDAMTHARAYRQPLPEDRAIIELKQFAGVQFDDRLVREFVKMLPEYKKIVAGEPTDEVVVRRLKTAA